MIRLAHVSDLHFGTESPSVVNALRTTLAELAPDVVVVSGDLTQRAHRREFAAARQFLDGLERPIAVVPGNHDIPLFNPLKRAFRPFRRYRDTFGSTDTAWIRHGRLRLVTVNSVRPERHASGRISLRQRLRVASIASAAEPGDVTVVVVHHPPGEPAVEPAGESNVGTTIDSTTIRQTPLTPESHDARTCDLWQQAGVRLVLSGHLHRPFLVQGAAPGANGADGYLWLLSAGTAISKRLRHEIPNTFNLIDIPDAYPRTGSPAASNGTPNPAAPNNHTDAQTRLVSDSTSEPAPDRMRVERWDHRPGADRFERHEGRDVSLK